MSDLQHTDDPAIGLYAAQMEEIKKRTDVVKCFLARQCTAHYDVPSAECVALQIRKILELIALASLVVNKAEYAAHHEKFAEHWKAKDILDNIKRVNPRFYPVPTKQHQRSDGVFDNIKIDTGFLTVDNFKTLYDQCCKLLHIRNPFSKSAMGDAQQFMNDASIWMNKIRTLLNHHEIILAGRDQLVICIMKSKDDGRPHATLFERVK